MLTLIALTAFLLEKTMAWDWKWIKTPLDKPFIALVVLCLLSSVFSLHRPTSLWSMILLLNYLVIFYLTIHTFRTRSQLRQLVYLIIGIAAFLSIFGLFKRGGLNPFPWWDYTDISQNQAAVSSTLPTYNQFAGYMEMALPLMLGLFLFSYRGIRLFIMICLTLIMLTAFTLCLSRAGWFSLFIGMVFMAVALLSDRHFKKKKLIVGLAGGFFVVLFVILSSTPVVERIMTLEKKMEIPNFRLRVTAWKGIIKMIEANPLLGTGPGTFATVYTQYQPPGLPHRYFKAHNDYLHFTSEVGLLLIPVVLWLIIALYRKGFKKLKNPSRLVRGITLGAMSGITAILVHSVGDFNLHIPCNALLFAILSAIVVAPLPKKS